MKKSSTKQSDSSVRHLAKIMRFFLPYGWRLSFAIAALVFTAAVALSIGQGIKFLFDKGFISGSTEQLEWALLVLFGITILLAVALFFAFI